MNIAYRIQRKSKKLLREYLLRNEFIKKTKYGFSIKLNVSKDVDKHFYWGEFEYELINFLSLILNKCSVFIDIGANIGIYTLLASQQMKNMGKVYAFEPSGWAYDRLLENLRINNFNNVETFKIAVSDITGNLKFHMCDDDAYNSLSDAPMQKVKEVIEIQSVRLENFCEECGIKVVDIIKIDAEGADYRVLKGAENILKSNPSPMIICELNKNILKSLSYTKKDFISFMKSFSYDFYSLSNEFLIKIDLENYDVNELICIKNYHIEKFELKIKA